jgi:hypothetical protein
MRCLIVFISEVVLLQFLGVRNLSILEACTRKWQGMLIIIWLHL